MTDDLPDVDFELSRLLRRQRVRALKRAAEMHPSLDFTSYLVLIAIYDGGGVRGTELAETFAVHKSTISRSITTLERLGLAERLADPRDGRAQLLKASSKAATRIEEIRARGHQLITEMLSGWTEREQAAFAAGLARFNDTAEQFQQKW